MTDVFISYSRKDKDFVSTLYAAFERSKKNIWVDWNNIPLTSDWWAEIEKGIESADTFVFVISPDSIASEVCTKEIDHAVLHNKRLFPIVRRDANNFEVGNVAHEKIKQHNWLMFREQDDFEKSFKMLTETISLDLEHLHSHTRLLVRAIEWGKGRSDSLLLRGDDLASAERWLGESAGKDPQPTELQETYIKNSRDVEDASDRAISILKDAERKAKNLVKVGSLFLVGTLLVAGVGAWVSVDASNRKIALAEVTLKTVKTKVALSDGDGLKFMLLALDTGNKLKQIANQSQEWQAIQQDVVSILQQATYLVPKQNLLQGHTGLVNSANFSADGSKIVTASSDNTARVWDVKGTLIAELKGHTDRVNSANFSVDGSKIVTASSDNTARVWDVKGTLIAELKGHTGGSRVRISVRTVAKSSPLLETKRRGCGMCKRI